MGCILYCILIGGNGLVIEYIITCYISICIHSASTDYLVQLKREISIGESVIERTRLIYFNENADR